MDHTAHEVGVQMIASAGIRKDLVQPNGILGRQRHLGDGCGCLRCWGWSRGSRDRRRRGLRCLVFLEMIDGNRRYVYEAVAGRAQKQPGDLPNLLAGFMTDGKTIMKHRNIGRESRHSAEECGGESEFS